MAELEFTGERVVPGKVGECLWHEHLARYRFAARFAAGKVILDAGCGAGYGADLLAAGGGAHILGIDVAPEAIAYARAHYRRPNLAFHVMDAERLDLPDAAFDLVVSFEVIEHFEAHDRFLRELARVLKADGRLFASTPNRDAHPHGAPLTPFHHRELNRDEFQALLRRHFAEVRLLAQAELPRAAGQGAAPFATTRKPRYWVALCSKPRKTVRAAHCCVTSEPGVRISTPRHPILSVAIATRNYGRYLPRALDSVFRCHNPTRAPIQVVVADDASTDETHAVLADYRLRYRDRLEVVARRTSAGAAAAKNAALDRCTGRFIATLDADDEFLPDKLFHCCAELERGGVDLVTNDFYEQQPSGQRRLRSRQTWPYWFWPPSTWVFRNGVVRFHPLYAAAEDMEWMERHWREVRHRHLDLPLNIQHRHGSQLHQTWDGVVPSHQMMGWISGRPHPNDGLAPSGWACGDCGTQYLQPARCCGRHATARPLLFYLPTRSPHSHARVEFSLVILTRNGLALTRRAVTSLLERLPAGHGHEFELIFVDGCSTDGTWDYIRELAQTHSVKLVVTHPREPFNYSRACNRGARAAAGRYLFLLNNDIEVESDDPWGPLRAALADPRIGVVGASTVWSAVQHDPEWSPGSPPYRRVDRPLTGAFWGARREVYWELGAMDEAFAGYGYEELDFQFRARLAHYHLALARVTVRHEEHGTFGPVFGAPAMHAMEAVNRRVFERKHQQPVYTLGPDVEPFAGHEGALRSLVIAAQDEAPRLQETLDHAAADADCRSGRVQLVVVDNGSRDDTALMLEAYRPYLSRCLTTVTLAEPVSRTRAERIGAARAAGTVVDVLAPGDRHPMRTPAAHPTRRRA